MAPETLTVIEKLQPGDVFRWEKNGLIYLKVSANEIRIGHEKFSQFAKRVDKLDDDARRFKIGAQVVFLRHLEDAV